MIIEILFSEVCGLYGDAQNAKYLEATLPEASFIYTPLFEKPYFVEHDVNMIYLGAMSENNQRRVIEVLTPYRQRLEEIINAGVPILATGNAGEIFARSIHYVTENIKVDGLNFFNLDVKTDLFDRYNGKVLAEVEGIPIVGFRSQFSFLYGDNTDCCFVECRRGIGINRKSKLEGMRKKNLICTQLVGPLLPLNPLFTEYLVGLTGVQAKAAYRDAALDAFQQRKKEFENPKTVFDYDK